MSGKWKPATAALAVCLCVVTLTGCASAPQLKGNICDHLGKTEVVYVTPKDEIVVTDPAMTEAAYSGKFVGLTFLTGGVFGVGATSRISAMTSKGRSSSGPRDGGQGLRAALADAASISTRVISQALAKPLAAPAGAQTAKVDDYGKGLVLEQGLARVLMLLQGDRGVISSDAFDVDLGPSQSVAPPAPSN